MSYQDKGQDFGLRGKRKEWMAGFLTWIKIVDINKFVENAKLLLAYMKGFVTQDSALLCSLVGTRELMLIYETLEKIKENEDFTEQHEEIERLRIKLIEAIFYLKELKIQANRKMEIYERIQKDKDAINELKTEEAKDLFSKIPYCEDCGAFYRWYGTASLFGYFADITSKKLDIRQSNDRIPWKKYNEVFHIKMKELSTAKSAVNDYTNKEKPKPEGYRDIDRACK